MSTIYDLSLKLQNFENFFFNLYADFIIIKNKISILHNVEIRRYYIIKQNSRNNVDVLM